MAEILLFHHAQGLTDGVRGFADALREAGHTVHTPDLLDGRTFDTLEEGIAHVEALGFPEVQARGRRAAEALPARLVYVGFSLGVVAAQLLAQTREGAQAAVLCHAAVPPTELGEAWPAAVPVQIHAMDADPIFVGEGDIEAAREIVAQADDGRLFLYPGDEHYFADSSLPGYDAEAAGLLTERVLALLAEVDRRQGA